jgi:hypothetical protein
VHYSRQVADSRQTTSISRSIVRTEFPSKGGYVVMRNKSGSSGNEYAWHGDVSRQRWVGGVLRWPNPLSQGAAGFELTWAERESLCQERLPHCGHFINERVRGRPTPFQRMPPNSQIDRANPHEHCIIHEREWSSMLAAHERGRMRTKNSWRGDITALRGRALVVRTEYAENTRLQPGMRFYSVWRCYFASREQLACATGWRRLAILPGIVAPQ